MARYYQDGRLPMFVKQGQGRARDTAVARKTLVLGKGQP